MSDEFKLIRKFVDLNTDAVNFIACAGALVHGMFFMATMEEIKSEKVIYDGDAEQIEEYLKQDNSKGHMRLWRTRCA